MWPLAGAVMVLGGLLPSLLHWLSAQEAPGRGVGDVWGAALTFAALDATFVAAALLFLWLTVRYCSTRDASGTHAPAAPYPGAWMEADGRQHVPRGFPGYLAFAFVIAVIVPAGVLLGCLAADGLLRALAAATLGPYLLVFVPQMLLETRRLNRSVVTPLLPLLFAPYRLWQFVRSLSLVGGHRWLQCYLASLLAFWVFDNTCTLVWLPGMYEWQLQDAALLARLSGARATQRGAAKARPPVALVPDSPAAAAKARHRGAGQSGDLDAYSFGA